MSAENWSDNEFTVPNPSQRNVWEPPSSREPIPSPAQFNTPLPIQNALPQPPSLARESAARARVRQRRTRRRGGEWAWVVVAFALFSVVLVISMSLALLVRASQGESVIVPTAAAVLPTPVDVRADFRDLTRLGTGERITLDDGRTVVLQPWDGESRFTILMMGLDRRPGQTGLGYRTDTMMLVSLDPENDTVGILSIPRDLYVEVPGYGQLQRVNSPMVLGELQQPGNGPRLAMQTVQYNLGIRVHEFVAVDFNAVITMIDAVGGVEIDVPYDIVDYQMPDLEYGYDPLIIRAGTQLMNGYTALRYARTRHGDSDFARAERQQQVITAFRDRVLALEMLPQLIGTAPGMLGHLRDSVYTGLSVDQIIQLALFAKDIPAENIRRGVIDGRYIMPYTTPQGASVLVPNRSMLGQLMIEVFGANYSE